MKSKTLNTLSYTGVVTLSRYIGSKKVELTKIHNSGTLALFDFLADCFIGAFTDAEDKRPTKIKVLNRTVTPDGVTSYTSASGFVHLLTTPEKVFNEKANQIFVCYSFLVPRDIINNIANTKGLALGLYAKKALKNEENTEDFSAVCNIDSIKDLSTNTSLVVDWELAITNSK